MLYGERSSVVLLFIIKSYTFYKITFLNWKLRDRWMSDDKSIVFCITDLSQFWIGGLDRIDMLTS